MTTGKVSTKPRGGSAGRVGSGGWDGDDAAAECRIVARRLLLRGVEESDVHRRHFLLQRGLRFIDALLPGAAYVDGRGQLEEVRVTGSAP